MNLPEFLLGDNTDCEDAIFVIHTQYPRFIIDLSSEDMEWLADEAERLFVAAAEFYDREVERIEKSL